MTYFLDENFPRPALAQIQAAGHKASHALDAFSVQAASRRKNTTIPLPDLFPPFLTLEFQSELPLKKSFRPRFR